MKKATLLLIALIVFAASPLVMRVFAPPSNAPHLWFYSKDPATLNPPDPLPDPQTYDPKYIDSNPDGWIAESIVINPSQWASPYTIWLAWVVNKDESLDTKLIVSINDAAHTGIQTIKINGNTLTSWDTSGNPPTGLSNHGVFNSAEFYGYAEADVGDLYAYPKAPYKVAIIAEIALNNNPPADMKVHFDALGQTEAGAITRNPYSHDVTFVIPDLATAIMILAPFSALGVYAIRRRKK